MVGGNIAESKYGEKSLESSVRTVDCLRGRLLAERQASRNAKEDADKLGTKLMELENELRKEARARKRAENRLKMLLKKLESLNIIGDEQSCEEVSSVSSSSTTNPTVDHHQQESPQKLEEGGGGLVVAPTQLWNGNGQEPTSDLVGFGLGNAESSQLGCNQDSKMDDQSFEEIHNSMALVAVEVKMEEERRVLVDPQVLDQTVREVLDALRHAREQIQTSLAKRGRGRHNMAIRAG